MLTRTERARPSRAGAPSASGTLALRHLDTIRDSLDSDSAIADVLGVSPSQVSRWRKGQTPDSENADRLAGLALVVEMLGRWLHHEVILDWLIGPNAHLADRSPAFVLRHGQVAEAVAAVEALKAGVFA
jgi:transcriptional regulator with XRE-family HTH domain